MHSDVTKTTSFQALPADPSGSVTWIHLGDLHMTKAGKQNELDLGRIVDIINELFAHRGVSFVYLPGDIADDGSAAAYQVVRSHLDRLMIPWCGIVGDHDVHEKSFKNFETYISQALTGGFTVGRYRFLRLNAFADPRPDSFTVDQQQLTWLEGELQACAEREHYAVLLLHCYPSDLKQGGAALTELTRKYPVLLIDMGHTHYNELSNDGHLLYSATRSTGQIEEGPVGFSVVTIDDNVVSWHFVQPGSPDLVAITTPADRRLTVELPTTSASRARSLRAKVWSREPVESVKATLGDSTLSLNQDSGVLWTGELTEEQLASGPKRLTVEAHTVAGSTFSSAIELAQSAENAQQHFSAVDQDNAVGAWRERGILGTQLGPNKNGRKW